LNEVKNIQEAAYEIQKLDLKMNMKFEDEEAKEYQAKYKSKREGEKEDLI
jgi:hypothetical protein|tara:strand:+ start:217 stop:366 length:150 start_codon:yes stop_codon:yes gene_type:complete